MEYLVRSMPEPQWDRVPAVPLQHTSWRPPNEITATAQMCHNGQTIFVRMKATEPDFRAALTGSLDPVSHDSCLEFFFAPLADDERYFNFECNPLGTLCLGFGAERGRRVRQVVPDPALFRIRPFFPDGGWGITLEIPLSFVRLYFPSASLRGAAAGNFYKCGDETPSPHYLSWAPLSCSTPDFHRRWEFGRLIWE